MKVFIDSNIHQFYMTKLLPFHLNQLPPPQLARTLTVIIPITTMQCCWFKVFKVFFLYRVFCSCPLSPRPCIKFNWPAPHIPLPLALLIFYSLPATNSRDEPSRLVACSVWNMNWQHTAPAPAFSVEKESVSDSVSEWVSEWVSQGPCLSPSLFYSLLYLALSRVNTK